MLKDITLGQFFPGKTIIHRIDARIKIVLTMIFIVILFMISGPISYAIMIAYVGLIIRTSKIPLKMILKGLKPILFIIVFTAALNIFYTAGDVIWEFGILHITKQGIIAAVLMVLRITLLITGTSMLTYTTSPIMLTDSIEALLSPLKKIKAPVHELAMMMSIALRFIPTLIEETDKIMCAQKARGADFESGSIIQRARALVPILVPLFISAFRRADELAVAMECRLYRGDVGRTRLFQFKITKDDYFACIFFTIIMVSAIVIAKMGF